MAALAACSFDVLNRLEILVEKSLAEPVPRVRKQCVNGPPADSVEERVDSGTRREIGFDR